MLQFLFHTFSLKEELKEEKELKEEFERGIKMLKWICWFVF